MLSTPAISNYRSLLHVVMPLGPLNVITGANASGKSNLYRALRLLAETARGGVVQALAREGGLDSTLWAGPESLSRSMRNGTAAVQGTPRKKSVRLSLGFAGDDFGYAISFGLPSPSSSAFSRDPEIKRECIWAGPFYRPASALIDRDRNVIKVRSDKRWETITEHATNFESMFSQVADPARTPEPGLHSNRRNSIGWKLRARSADRVVEEARRQGFVRRTRGAACARRDLRPDQLLRGAAGDGPKLAVLENVAGMIH